MITAAQVKLRLYFRNTGEDTLGKEIVSCKCFLLSVASTYVHNTMTGDSECGKLNKAADVWMSTIA